MSKNKEFEGKRILFLGAHAFIIHLIDKAKEMGMYTIVTDYVKDAPAKKVADEAYDISTTDVDALVELAKKCHVDAVFTGYVDVNLAPCRKVCEALGLPFYATLEQIDATMNKANFKKNCLKYGVPVVNDVPKEYLDGKYDRIKYPVIVKPVDSYSSKGISVCFTKEEMGDAVEKAMQFSTCKDIIVEDFVTGDDIYLYFTIQDGYLSLSAMADRLLNSEQYGFAPQPVGYFFPSKYIELYYSTVHENMQNMISGLGLKNGSFFVQGFVIDNKIIFFEMGLRLSGGCGYLQIKNQNDVDQLEMHLRYAMTGKFEGYDLKTQDTARFKKPACVFVVLLNDGTITDIEGMDEIRENKNIFSILQLRYIGNKMESKGTLNQVFARIYISADDRADMIKTIDFIKNTLKITDENGNNMILNSFDDNDIPQ